MYKRLLKTAGILQDVLYKSVISGNIVADPGTANQVLLAYSKDTGELIGSTVWDAETKTYKLYLNEPVDEKIFLTRIDNGGTYFAETYDRVSTGVGTFVHGEEYDDLQDNAYTNLAFVGKKPGYFSFPFNIIHENLCKVNGIFSFPSNLKQGSVLSDGVYYPLGSKINGVLYADKNTIVCDASKSQHFSIAELIHSYNTNPFSDGSLLAAFPMILDSRDCTGNYNARAEKEWRYARGGYNTFVDPLRIDPFEIPLVINRTTTTTIFFEFSTLATSNNAHLYLLIIPDLIQLTYYGQLLYFYYLNPDMVSGTSYSVSLSAHHSIALVISPSGSDKLYIDGVLVATKTIVTPVRTNDSYFSFPGIRNGSTHDVVYHGAMVFNRELTLAEIQSLPSIGRQTSINIPSSIYGCKELNGIVSAGGNVPDPYVSFLIDGSIGNKYAYASWYASHYGILENATNIRFNGTTGLLYRINTKDTSNIDISIKFIPEAVTAQCIWKIGDTTQGVAIGINESAKLTLYARNAGTLTSISMAAALAISTEYTVTLTDGALTLYNATGAVVETITNTLTIGTYTGQESIGGAYNGSPITATAGNSGYFNGKIITLLIADKNSISTQVVNSENTLSVWNGETELPVEVVKWDMTDNKAVLWTRVPELTADGITLTIKSDVPSKSGLIGSALAQDVWCDSFLGVYHMEYDVILVDSTKNRFHGTLMNIGSSNFSTDLTGSKITFNGTDEYAVIPFPIISDLQKFSIFTTIQPTSIGENDPLIDVALDTDADAGLQLAMKFNASSQLNAELLDQEGVSIGSLTSNVISNSVNSHVTLNYNGKAEVDGISLIVDGIQIDSDIPSGKRLSDSLGKIYVGKDAYTPNYFNGSLSELFLMQDKMTSSLEKILRLSSQDALGTYVLVASTELWSPAEILVSLWLDAADSSTIVSGGGGVSSWNDKSGNEINAVQTTVVNQPAYNAIGLNNRGTINFNGETTMLTTNLPSNFSQEFSVFVVFKREHDPLAHQIILSCVQFYASTYSSFPVSLKVDGMASTMHCFLDSGTNWTADVDLQATEIAEDIPYIAYYDNKPAASSNLYIDGVQAGTAAGVSTSNSGYNYSIGKAPEYSGGIGLTAYTGAVAEIIMIPEQITVSLRQKIEGYLAYKWGLTAHLALDHPYKNTPPLKEVSTIDPYWNETVLCMPMNGANNSTVFTDLKGKTVTPYGNARISIDQSKFGGASAYFDGTGDYLTIPYELDIDLMGVSFTAEAWIYLASLSGGDKRVMSAGGGVVAWNSTTGIHWDLQVNTSNFRPNMTFWAGSTTVSVTHSQVLATNRWYHLAVSRDGSTTYIAVDGIVEEFSTPNITRPSSNPSLAIGTIPGENGGNDSSFPGYIDYIRITKGVARYTSDFTPPTKELGQYIEIVAESKKYLTFDIAESTVDSVVNDAPVMLTLSDSSGLSALDVTSIFDSIKTEYSKPFGTNPILSEFGFLNSGLASFNTPYITFEKGQTGLDNTAFKFTGNVNSIVDITNCISRGLLVGSITFSMWIKLDIFQASSTELLLFGTTGASEFQLTHRNNGELVYRHTSTGFVVGNVRKGKWSHVVIVRDNVNKTYKSYINGVLKYEATYTTIPAVTTNSIFIGGTTTVASGCTLSDIKLHGKALTPFEVDALYNSYNSYFKGTTTSILFQDIPILLGEELSNISATNSGSVYYALSNDKKTYYIKSGTTWKPIASNDPVVHGFIGDADPYFWDDTSSEWVFSRVPMEETISKAVTFLGNRMTNTQLSSITDFSGVYDSAVGLIHISTSLTSDGSFQSSVAEVVINNKQYWLSDVYALSDYASVILSSAVKISVVYPTEGINYRAATKVYGLISGETSWTEYTDETIPNLPVGFVTAGKTIQFKVVWDKSVWGSTPKDISVELIIK